MKSLILILVISGTAAAQTPAPINFDGRDDKAATNNLPALGGSGMSFEKPPTRSSESSSTPYPKDSNPNQR